MSNFLASVVFKKLSLPRNEAGKPIGPKPCTPHKFALIADGLYARFNIYHIQPAQLSQMDDSIMVISCAGTNAQFSTGKESTNKLATSMIAEDYYLVDAL